MFSKLLAAALLVAAPVPASAPAPSSSAIPLVVCISPKGVFMGSAFRVGPKLLVSVAHVTSLPGCYIDGHKIRVIYTKQDFSLVTDDWSGPYLPIDCGGFIKDRRYVALGHPRGVEEIVPVSLIGTGQTDDGMAVLTGIFTAQPGHSGGPIIDAGTKKVVGVVNAADWEGGYTLSVELKSTPVCSKS